MNRPFALRSLGIFGLLSAMAMALSAASCGSKDGGSECGLDTCDNGVRFQRNLQVTNSQIPSLSISLCRNTSDCATLVPVVQKDGTYTCTSTPATASCLLTQDQDTGWSLSVDTATSIANPKNGDAWTITVTDTSTKASLLSVSEMVDYSPQYLNGDNCGVACETAIIK